MLYREIMAVCSEIHTKHINTLCGQNVELLNVKLVVHIVTTGLESLLLESITFLTKLIVGAKIKMPDFKEYEHLILMYTTDIRQSACCVSSLSTPRPYFEIFDTI